MPTRPGPARLAAGSSRHPACRRPTAAAPVPAWTSGRPWQPSQPSAISLSRSQSSNRMPSKPKEESGSRSLWGGNRWSSTAHPRFAIVWVCGIAGSLTGPRIGSLLGVQERPLVSCARPRLKHCSRRHRSAMARCWRPHGPRSALVAPTAALLLAALLACPATAQLGASAAPAQGWKCRMAPGDGFGSAARPQGLAQGGYTQH